MSKNKTPDFVAAGLPLDVLLVVNVDIPPKAVNIVIDNTEDNAFRDCTPKQLYAAFAFTFEEGVCMSDDDVEVDIDKSFIITFYDDNGDAVLTSTDHPAVSIVD